MKLTTESEQLNQIESKILALPRMDTSRTYIWFNDFEGTEVEYIQLTFRKIVLHSSAWKEDSNSDSNGMEFFDYMAEKGYHAEYIHQGTYCVKIRTKDLYKEFNK